MEYGDSVSPPIHSTEGSPRRDRRRFTSPMLGSRMKTQIRPTRMGAMIAGAKTSARRAPTGGEPPIEQEGQAEGQGDDHDHCDDENDDRIAQGGPEERVVGKT